MFSSTIAKVAAGVIVALAVALGVAGWQLKRSWQAESATKAALSDALSANATLVKEAARYKADAKAEAERAMQRQKDRDTMAAQLMDLRRALGDDACGTWTPEKAEALDRFLQGGKP